MTPLPILRFEPLLKEVVWGGRRLETLMGRSLPAGAPIGETWELVDLSSDQSVVTGGAFSGVNLEQLVKEHPVELLGGAPLLDGRFPLLFKFIDANATLSVQVHPDEGACARLGGGARPKTEAWYIIDAQPGAALYVGLVPGVTRETFSRALDEGTVADLLHRLPVSAGDFVYLPSGTVHAIGEGIVLAEVQQSSATTYRVFDWNRVGLDGNPRQLHIEQALESTDFSQVGPPRMPPPSSGRPGVSCPYFEMETLLTSASPVKLEGDGPLVIMGVQGAGHAIISAGDSSQRLKIGETVMVPSCISRTVEVEGDGDLSVLSVRILQS